MIRIAIAAAAIMACATAAWSQAYYEASGQTAVFTLAAGAKTGSTANLARFRGVVVSGINVSVARSGVIVTLPATQHGTADIAFYNIAGRQIYQQQGYSGKTIRFEARHFKSGIYAVRICVDGQIYARRFAFTGQGE